jgi:hypothetical protein
MHRSNRQPSVVHAAAETGLSAVDANVGTLIAASAA